MYAHAPGHCAWLLGIKLNVTITNSETILSSVFIFHKSDPQRNSDHRERKNSMKNFNY